MPILELTLNETKALYGATFYITGVYGVSPIPPPPGVTAQEKLEVALGIKPTYAEA